MINELGTRWWKGNPIEFLKICDLDVNIGNE